MSKFYSFYYFAQNVGSLGGELGCPLLREHVSFVATFATVLASVVRYCCLVNVLRGVSPIACKLTCGNTGRGGQGLAMVFFFWGRPVFVRNEGDLPSERGEYTK